MPKLSLTPKMKEALERLYETSGQQDRLNMHTANALERRELVAINKQTSMTHGGAFPYLRTVLMDAGTKWCERHSAVTGKAR